MSSIVSLTRSATLASIAQYAYSATAPAGSRYIFFAGVCPLTDEGTTAAVGDYAGQAEVVVENMLTALAEAGASITDVIFSRVSVATTHQDDLIAAWDVVRAAFGTHDVPSTLVGVTLLGYDDQLVELEIVAAVAD